MTATNFDGIRSHIANWPEPVNIRDRYLEPFGLTMESIVATENDYVNIAEIKAEGNNNPVRQGDWFKMVRWTLGYYRPAASAPMVQNEIIMAHVGNTLPGTHGLSNALYPGVVLAHLGAVGASGTGACNDGHRKIVDYAVQWFHDNGGARTAVTWDMLWRMLNAMKEQASNESNASEGVQWINGMLTWLKALPMWSNVARYNYYIVAHVVDPKFNGNNVASRLGEIVTWNHNAVAVGDVWLGMNVDRWGSTYAMLREPRAYSEQHYSRNGHLTMTTGPGLVTSASSLRGAFANDAHWTVAADGTEDLNALGAHLEHSHPNGMASYNGIVVRSATGAEVDAIKGGQFEGFDGFVTTNDDTVEAEATEAA